MIILTEFKLNFIESIIYIKTTFKNFFLIKVYFNSLSLREQLSIYIKIKNKHTVIYFELNKKIIAVAGFYLNLKDSIICMNMKMTYQNIFLNKIYVIFSSFRKHMNINTNDLKIQNNNCHIKKLKCQCKFQPIIYLLLVFLVLPI